MPDFDRLRETAAEMQADRDGAIVDDLIPDIAKTYRTDLISLVEGMTNEEVGMFKDTVVDETNALMAGTHKAVEYAAGISDLICKYADIVAEREAWAMVKGE